MSLPQAAPSLPPPRRRGHAGTHLFLGCCVMLVTVFLVWANFGRLDVVSLAIGEVVPATKVKSIQHLEGGIVRKILVREGDRVTRGQALIELEPLQTGADLAELEIRMRALTLGITRLEAEASGQGTPDFPPEIARKEPDLVRQEIELFRTRRSRVDNQIQSQRQQIIERDQEIKEVQARLRNNAVSLKLLTEQLKISNKLLSLDLSNRMSHLNLLKEESELTGKIETDRATLPRARAAQEAARSQLRAVISGFKEEAQKELNDVRRTARELVQRMRKYQDNLRRTVLRSPVDGIVKTLYVFTEGGVIQPASTVLDVVPGDDRLVIEAKLATQDIGYVRIGQNAQVQLASADAARFGFLKGKVTNISPDTIVTRDGMPFYKVRIVTERDHFESGDLVYRLSPGMQVQSSILTGTRTVMRYLLDPYLGSMGKAMQER